MSAETASTAPPKRRASRWLWIGFVSSLALNLIVVGIVIGAIWKWHQGQVYRQAGAPRHFGAFLRKLPAERREVLQRIFAQRRPEFDQLRRNLRAARRAAREAMAQVPFSPEQFAIANRKLHEARAQLRLRRSDIFPSIAAAMTADERRLFLTWREHHRQRWRRWHGRGD